MIKISDNSRQPDREAWTMERVNAELTINLGMAIDRSTHNSYTSALNLYLTFCCLHNLDVEPTPRNLALLITFKSTFINPKSVDSYLSDIANQLETHFPDVRVACKTALVTCAWQGVKHRHGVPTAQKLPLTRDNLITVINAYQYNPTYDNILFITQLLTSFNCLLCLGELTWPDKLDLHDYQKVSMQHTVEFLADSLSFWLPGHKVDQHFEGNHLIICKHSTPDTYSFFVRYLDSCDKHFWAHPELWLCVDGTIPTRAWFINCLQHFFPSSITGQSMQAGGAMSLAESVVVPNLIQVAGRWTSETFNCYVWKNSFLFKALLVGRSSLRFPAG